jgi:hypothetical protein
MLKGKDLQRAEFLLYSENVRKLTEKNAKRYFVQNIEKRGSDYHLDHMLSIKDGFIRGMPEAVIAHPCNLVCISAKENLSKGPLNTISFEELLEDIDDFDSSI